jgi:hypothetical protein
METHLRASISEQPLGSSAAATTMANRSSGTACWSSCEKTAMPAFVQIRWRRSTTSLTEVSTVDCVHPVLQLSRRCTSAALVHLRFIISFAAAEPGTGAVHKVYFPTPWMLSSRLNSSVTHGLGGISIWEIGQGVPALLEPL